jgi:hypothetical protein
LIRSQAAAFRKNSSNDESSGPNLTSEDASQSPQNLLPQDFSSIALIKLTKLIFDEEMFIIEVLMKAAKISSLNESSN